MRTSLRLSQTYLARVSGVSRFKICTYELGDGALTAEEQIRILKALRGEVERLRGVSFEIDFDCRVSNPLQEAR